MEGNQMKMREALFGVKRNAPECDACPLWTSGLGGDNCQLKWAQTPYEADEKGEIDDANG